MSPKMTTQSIDVNELLMQLPAENKIQRDLVINALLSLDEQKLVEAGRLLESQDIILNNQAEYAFHGMALYLAKTGNKLLLEKYFAITGQLLKEGLSLKRRIFLLEQLKYIPDGNAADIAAIYLTDDALSETAVMVLQSINSVQAADALMAALSDASEDQKSAMILALAEMNYRNAAQRIFDLLPTDNHDLEISALTALAKLGYEPAQQFIQKFVKQNNEKSELLLLFGQSLAVNGEKTKSEAVFREIFKNQSSIFNNSQRSAALYGLSGLLKVKAFDDIFNAFNENSKTIRINALKLAQQYKSANYIQKWIDVAHTKAVQQQMEIINFLGIVKSKTALAYLKEKLADKNPPIQAAAIKALAGIQGKEIEKDLKTVLKNDLQEELYTETENILLHLQDSLALKEVINGFNTYSFSGKKLTINVIATRRLTTFSEILMNLLNSEDQELKAAALDGLAVLARGNHFQNLIQLYLNAENKLIQHKFIKAVIASFTADSYADSLLYLFDAASEREKIKLLEIFRQLGGKKLFQNALQFTSNIKGELGNEVKDIFLKWNDDNALPFLINMARTEEDEKVRIQAIHSAVLIFKNENLTKTDIVSNCAILFDACSRAEEKRLLLSVLAEIKNKSALELLVKKISDPDIEFNVFLALLSWAKTNSNDSDALRTEDLVVNLVKGRISDSLDDQIILYRKEKFKAQPPEGFTALFNGWDLSGWKGLVANPVKRAQMTPEEIKLAQQKADSIMHASWAVIDGMLCFIGTGYPNICTIADYENFELYLDWKIEKDSDSGIYLRGSPQVQIWDPAYNGIGSGGLFNNNINASVPLQIADKPVGEWNTFHIIMKGQRVSVFLNDKLVVDNVILENYWERDKEIYPRGQIELQAHNSPLYFKNIFIKELPAEPALLNGPLFNKKDLSGWQVIDNQNTSWKVKDSLLFCEGQGGGWLSTEKEFGNFELQLEFRLPDGGNSGVFIRAPHQGDPAYSGMEIQLLDDYSEKYTDLKEWQYTGSVYGLQAPNMRVSKKANQWQKMTIICQGPQINVILNDKKIIDANLADFSYAEEKHPGIKRRKGFIGLQNHNSRVEFRNIVIKELP